MDPVGNTNRDIKGGRDRDFESGGSSGSGITNTNNNRSSSGSTNITSIWNDLSSTTSSGRGGTTAASAAVAAATASIEERQAIARALAATAAAASSYPPRSDRSNSPTMSSSSTSAVNNSSTNNYRYNYDSNNSANYSDRVADHEIARLLQQLPPSLRHAYLSSSSPPSASSALPRREDLLANLSNSGLGGGGGSVLANSWYNNASATNQGGGGGSSAIQELLRRTSVIGYNNNSQGGGTFSTNSATAAAAGGGGGGGGGATAASATASSSSSSSNLAEQIAELHALRLRAALLAGFGTGGGNGTGGGGLASGAGAAAAAHYLNGLGGGDHRLGGLPYQNVGELDALRIRLTAGNNYLDSAGTFPSIASLSQHHNMNISSPSLPHQNNQDNLPLGSLDSRYQSQVGTSSNTGISAAAAAGGGGVSFGHMSSEAAVASRIRDFNDDEMDRNSNAGSGYNNNNNNNIRSNEDAQKLAMLTHLGGNKSKKLTLLPPLEDGDVAHYSKRHIVPLGIEEDPNWLSERQCFIRSELLEVIRAGEDEVLVRSSSKSIAHKQVGIRCRYCAHLQPGCRAIRASAFPTSIRQIYQSFTMMVRDHFGNCDGVPQDKKERFLKLKGLTSPSSSLSRQYWTFAAKKLGMVDTPSGIVINEETLANAEKIPPFGTTIAESEGVKATAVEGLLDTDDQRNISPYLYLLMSQAQVVRLLPSERVGKRKDAAVGLTGFGCKYCAKVGRLGFCRMFPLNKRSLPDKTNDFFNHIMRCPNCPSITKRLLESRRTEQESNRAFIDRDRDFIDRIWYKLGRNTDEAFKKA